MATELTALEGMKGQGSGKRKLAYGWNRWDRNAGVGGTWRL